MRASLRDRLVTGRNDYEATPEDSSYNRLMFGGQSPSQPSEHADARQGTTAVKSPRSSLDGED